MDEATTSFIAAALSEPEGANHEIALTAEESEAGEFLLDVLIDDANRAGAASIRWTNWLNLVREVSGLGIVLR